MKEEWKTIPGFEKHLISSYGRLFSKINNKYLKFTKNKNNSRGYLALTIKYQGTAKYFKVHRLVALCFLENPHKKPIVNHKDGNKLNNRIENLEWATHAENVSHAKLNNLFATGENSKKSNLTWIDVKSIRNRYLERPKHYKWLADEYGIDPRAIFCIVNNITWKV